MVLTLRPLVEEVVRLLRVTLPTGVELNATFDAGTPAIAADASQIHQAVMNLCTNAWQALEGGPGRIGIHVDGVSLGRAANRIHPDLHAGRFARVVVSDTGAGMDPATMERIFEPFFTTRAADLGTGLGLAVVHGIVHSHGGAITVRSTPGAGTTFEIYLPARGGMEARGGVEESPYPRGSGQHVLYVDDEHRLVQVTERILGVLGYRATGFTDASEALAAVRADPGRFDLLLTDLNMPDLPGFELIREVLKIRPGLPMVITSGFVTDELLTTATSLGITEILGKPSHLEELAAALQRLLPSQPPDGPDEEP
jgi:CheY-like chemotaxis protein